MGEREKKKKKNNAPHGKSHGILHIPRDARNAKSLCVHTSSRAASREVSAEGLKIIMSLMQSLFLYASSRAFVYSQIIA